MKLIPLAVTTVTVFWDMAVIFKRRPVISSKFRCNYAKEPARVSLNVLAMLTICLL
jgi:hypothetical protein